MVVRPRGWRETRVLNGVVFMLAIFYHLKMMVKGLRSVSKGRADVWGEQCYCINEPEPESDIRASYFLIGGVPCLILVLYPLC